MKPPIEYRPKRKPLKPKAPSREWLTPEEARRDIGEFIIIRRNRTAYNAYMRAYRAKKKAEK